jgi:hypothetical protein
MFDHPFSAKAHSKALPDEINKDYADNSVELAALFWHVLKLMGLSNVQLGRKTLSIFPRP